MLWGFESLLVTTKDDLTREIHVAHCTSPPIPKYETIIPSQKLSSQSQGLNIWAQLFEGLLALIQG